MTMFNLYGKVALITGSGSGMGRMDALSLASQGAKVILTGRKEGDCDRVAEEIGSQGGESYAYAMDVSKKEQIDVIFDKVMKRFGRIDILVNNAGIFKPKPALDITEAEWDEMLSINLRGQFFCAQRAAKEMKKNNWGRIINISSIASGGAGIGFSGAAHYTASKGGILGMTETLADEWAEYGITVNAIAPGAIDTPMVDAAHMSKKAMQATLAHIPLKRLGKPEEISAAVVFLASEEASYVTGATLYVDGGWLAA
ncbi:SDR family oxidoreductase [Candidatus Peregrinibacteria bacterium]|nr:SDR family oxidoreductase [Candidatus Peregrinibacteria bacterium]